MNKKVIKQLGVLTGLLMAPLCQAENLLEIYELSNNNSAVFLAAVAEYEAAKEASPQAWAAVLPQLNLQGQHSNIDEDRTISGTTTIDSYDTDQYTLSLTQTIYNQSQFDQISQASAQVAAAGANFAHAKHELILRVAQRYFDVLAANDTLLFSRAEKQSIKEQLHQTRERFRVGLIAITDVHEAQARYDQAVASEIDAENKYTISLEDLRVVTNKRITSLVPLTTKAPLIVPEPADINAWVKTALDNNLLLLAADKSKQAARHALGIARSGHLPTLDLEADYTDYESSGGRFGALEQDSTTVSLVLTIPLYAGGGVNSASRQAAANYEKARQKHEQQRRLTISKARNAYLTAISNISRVKALKQALRSSKTALEATQAGYEAGTRTAVDVLDSQRDLFHAQRNYAHARYNYIMETLRLKQAAGTLAVKDLQQVNAWLQ